MRQVRYYEYGGPDVLRLERAEAPEPGPGQVRLRVEAIGANYVDTMFRRNTGGPFSRALPAGLTGDVVGVVDALGPGVTGVRAGDRVAALADPAFAEQVLADADWLAPVPAGLDPVAASLLPMAGPVALRVLRSGQLAAGETVLVHAAAGGIGHLAVQLARRLGAGTVIGTASSPAKLALFERLGADVAIDYTAPDWIERVRAAAPGGVDLIADSAGGEISRQGLDLLAPFGRVVFYGAAAGEFTDVPFGVLARLRTATGFSLLAWRAARPEQARAEMTEVSALLADGTLRAAHHATVPLADTARAHRILEERANLGRVLVLP